MSADVEERTHAASQAESQSDKPPHSPNTDAEKAGPAFSGQISWGQDAPYGGLEAWLVILGNWCASFCSFGWINRIFYSAQLLSDYSEGNISWIPSLQIFFMMAMGPIVGKTFDTYGPYWLMIGGPLLHVFGLMMASLSTKYYQILLSQGVYSVIALACIPTWFNKNRGMAYGIAATGGICGGISFPILIEHLMTSLNNGWAMRISAFLILFLLLIATSTVKTSNKPTARRQATRDQLIQPLTEFAFVAAVSEGMDEGVARYLVPILNGGSLLGRLLSGLAGDKIGRYNTFIIVCHLAPILLLSLWIPASTNKAIIAFTVLFGFFSGAYISLIAVLIVQISPLREIGTRTGLVFLLASVGELTTGPMAGRVLGESDGWTSVKVFSGVLCVAGTTFVLAARVKLAGLGLRTVF
ncbi:major facilitator superfamily domain-containing protein [Aspergillus venezuelensis]